MDYAVIINKMMTYNEDIKINGKTVLANAKVIIEVDTEKGYYIVVNSGRIYIYNDGLEELDIDEYEIIVPTSFSVYNNNKCFTETTIFDKEKELTNSIYFQHCRTYYDYDFNIIRQLSLAEKYYKLDNDKYIINEYGKYKPNLTFLADTPIDISHHSSSASSDIFNICAGKVLVIRGVYFTSKKGTKCFKIDNQGPHYFIEDSWGGSFNKYDGHELEKLNCLYYRRASSNGGGSGYDYCIIKTTNKYNFKNQGY